MEVLVVTLAHTLPGREADGLARIRFIAETVRNAPGLVTARFYRSRGAEAYYFILTTWEDEELWKKAEERYSPKQLLLGTETELLTSPPEQWLMHYLWGYSRPAATPTLAAAHLATIRPEHADKAQRGWIESLRRQAVQPILSFAFLARGNNEAAFHTQPQLQRPLTPHPGLPEDAPYQHGPIFLNLLSWTNEVDQEDFYADENYQAIQRFLRSVGVVQVLPLDPM